MRINRHILHNALKELVRLAPLHHPMPVISDVLLLGTDDKLILTTTDITTRLTCELQAQGTPIKAACVSAKSLVSMTKPIGKKVEDVTLESTGDEVTMMTANGNVFRLPAEDPQTFPAEPSDEDWEPAGECQAKLLQAALAWVLPAASTDSSRPNLNSVLICRDAVVATDGHRLHSMPGPFCPDQPLLFRSMAATALSHILKRDDWVTITRRETEELRLHCGPWQLDTNSPDGQFPEYTRVIPRWEDQQVRMVFDSNNLRTELTQIARLSSLGYIRMHISGPAIVLSPDDSYLNEASIIVTALKSVHDGANFEVGAQSKYLLDAIPRTGTVEVGLCKKKDNPILVRADGRLAVIMPADLG